MSVGLNCGTTDYGDAPNSDCYGEAGHTIVYGGQGPKVKLGSSVDAESSYSGDANAETDDNTGLYDDEDGISFYEKQADGTFAPVNGDRFYVGGYYKVVVEAMLYPGETAKLAAWCDFYGNCTFGDQPQETIINNVILSNRGSSIATVSHSEEFSVPAAAHLTATYFRFRLDSQNADLQPTGLAGGYGEGEDGVAMLEQQNPVSIELISLNADPIENGVKITWSVASEINHAGYNLYRSGERDGEFVKINKSLIGLNVHTSLTEKQYEFVDMNPAPTAFYKLEDVSLDGERTWHGPVQVTISSTVETMSINALEFELTQNYPNPFNPVTTIDYTLSQNSQMRLDIYDMTGRQIKNLVNQNQQAGQYSVIWDGTTDYGERAASGMYMYKMTAGEFQKTCRMTLLR